MVARMDWGFKEFSNLPYFLAGLAGYSDSPMRLLSRAYGAPYCVTEAISVRQFLASKKEFEQAMQGEDWQFQDRVIQDAPLAAQIIGEDLAELEQVAGLLSTRGFAAIDVNLACPQKKKARAKSCQGGLYLQDRQKAIAVLKAVRAAVPAEIPTTVKLRRSFSLDAEMEQEFEAIFDAAYDLGYQWATVHARTVEQRYVGPADWSFLRDLVKRYPDRCILGSGDILKAEDIFRCLTETGLKAVSVARGAISNPWIFRHAELLAQALQDGRWEVDRPVPAELQLEQSLSPTELGLALREHSSLLMRNYNEQQSCRMLRKFGIKMSRLHPLSEDVHAAFVKCRKMEEIDLVLDRFF